MNKSNECPCCGELSDTPSAHGGWHCLSFYCDVREFRSRTKTQHAAAEPANSVTAAETSLGITRSH